MTEAMVEKMASPATGRVEIYDAIVPALALRVTSNGAKSFVVRGRIKGQVAPIRVTVGDADVMKITEARQAASDTLRQMKAGNDPREAKRDEKALTFDALIGEWAKLHLSRRRPRYAAEAQAGIRRGLANLLWKPADKITKADAVNALDRIVLAGHPVNAKNVMSYARACFGWAKKRGKVPANPFAELPIATGKSERERTLTDAEIRTIWAAAEKLAYPFGPFFQIAMLTLQRRDQVAAMRWSEIADDFAIWRLPGSRMKNGKPFDVHLSEPARTILRSLPRINDSEYVFTTGRRRNGGTKPAPISGFSQGKKYLDKAIVGLNAQAEPWVLHDFRRTGVTTLAKLGFDSIVADKLLAHQPEKLRGVAGIYQRHDFARERAQALDAWAAHITGQHVENVTPLRRVAQ